MNEVTMNPVVINSILFFQVKCVKHHCQADDKDNNRKNCSNWIIFDGIEVTTFYCLRSYYPNCACNWKSDNKSAYAEYHSLCESA